MRFSVLQKNRCWNFEESQEKNLIPGPRDDRAVLLHRLRRDRLRDPDRAGKEQEGLPGGTQGVLWKQVGFKTRN